MMRYLLPLSWLKLPLDIVFIDPSSWLPSYVW